MKIQKKSGFTLLELLVVVAMIIIVLGIIGGGIAGCRNRSGSVTTQQQQQQSTSSGRGVFGSSKGFRNGELVKFSNVSTAIKGSRWEGTLQVTPSESWNFYVDASDTALVEKLTGYARNRSTVVIDYEDKFGNSYSGDTSYRATAVDLVKR